MSCPVDPHTQDLTAAAYGSASLLLAGPPRHFGFGRSNLTAAAIDE
jgi:hypothetical protein